MPYQHIDLAVSAWARDYAESLLPGTNTVCIRLDALPEDPSLGEFAFNVAEYWIERFIYSYSTPGTPFLVVYELAHGKLSMEETNTNPHYHVFMEINVTIGALRAAVKRIWTGNSGYSLKLGVPQLVAQQFNYLCKGSGTGLEDPPKIIDRSDCLTDEVIHECHVLYWQNNDAIQAQKSKKRKTSDPTASLILAQCKHDLEISGKAALSEDDIIDITFEWYSTNKWSMNTFQMKAVITWISYNLNKNSNRVHLAKASCKF